MVQKPFESKELMIFSVQWYDYLNQFINVWLKTPEDKAFLALLGFILVVSVAVGF